MNIEQVGKGLQEDKQGGDERKGIPQLQLHWSWMGGQDTICQQSNNGKVGHVRSKDRALLNGYQHY